MLALDSQFATLLREHRLACGFTQDALAEAAGISASAVGAYERGVNATPHRDTVRLLADALRLVGTAREEFEFSTRRKPRLTGETCATARGNLPYPVTSFIGRERELEQIGELLRVHRIVTLTGSGGIGKTRLALRAANEVAVPYENGCWFVDFGKIVDENLVVSLVATTLGIPAPSPDEIDSFSKHLQKRELLLILDNCEHVVRTTGFLAAAIVRTCPGITILATSRERLRISGEAVLRVPTLALPALEPATVSVAQDYPAIALFVDRAKAVALDFALTEHRLSAVIDICRRLDGIPLAVELAAARLSTLGLAELQNKLNERFALLSVGPRDLAPRQQTLLATIDWSYNLLEEDERSLMRSLSAFAGSFTLGAATAIFERTAPADAVARLLSSLVEKSLLTAETDEDEDRYSMLDSTREYARNKIDAAEFDALILDYADWAASFADDCARTHFRVSQESWLRRIARDFESISRALTSALNSNRDPVTAARIVGGLRQYWTSIGRIDELARLATSLLDRIDGAAFPAIAGRLHLACLMGLDLHEQLRALETARTLFESAGDQKELAICHLYMAHAVGDDDPAAGLAETDLALTFARDAHVQRLFPHIANLRGELLFRQHHFDEARVLAEQAIEAFTAFGDVAFATSALHLLLAIEIDADRCEAAADVARRIEERTDALSADLQSNIRVSLILALACYRIKVGELEAALSIARSVLLDHQAEWKPYLVLAIECVATIVALRGELLGAARLYGFAIANDIVHYGFRLSSITCRPIVEAVLGRLTPSDRERNLADGATLTLDEAMQSALAAC